MESSLEYIRPTTGDVVQQIKQLVVEGLQVNVRADEIADDYSLLEDGLALDSILIAELVVLIENRFRIQFDDRALDVELFDNLTNLASFVVSECEKARAHEDAIHPGGLPC